MNQGVLKGCEVKRKKPQSGSQPRNILIGQVEDLIVDADNRDRRDRTSACLRPGVADGIEQHIVMKD